MCSKNSKPTYYCDKCGKKLNPKIRICPCCGYDKRLVKMTLSGVLTFRGSLIGRKFLNGIGKWVKEVISGWFPSVDTCKHPKGVEKIRVIDKENPKNIDSYQEKITDIKTGKITRDIKEPLEKHRHK
jgi:hypothetical protein